MKGLLKTISVAVLGAGSTTAATDDEAAEAADRGPKMLTPRDVMAAVGTVLTDRVRAEAIGSRSALSTAALGKMAQQFAAQLQNIPQLDELDRAQAVGTIARLLRAIRTVEPENNGWGLLLEPASLRPTGPNGFLIEYRDPPVISETGTDAAELKRASGGWQVHVSDTVHYNVINLEALTYWQLLRLEAAIVRLGEKNEAQGRVDAALADLLGEVRATIAHRQPIIAQRLEAAAAKALPDLGSAVVGWVDASTFAQLLEGVPAAPKEPSGA
jgi:hypothetical protein